MTEKPEVATGPVRRQLVYAGEELESMRFAVNYRRWILQVFRPFLGKMIVEVGAGTGSFSELILDTAPDAFTMLEPSNLFPVLSEWLHGRTQAKAVRAYPLALLDAMEVISKPAPPDSILYVNVLEHIEDDGKELAAAYAALADGGHICVFVPANPWLTSVIDRQMGHYRRYVLGDLRRKCMSAGFSIRLSSYFDFAGIFPWLIKYRLLGSTTMEPGLVRLYDRYIVPIMRIAESLIPPPIGKSIVLVGKKLQCPAPEKSNVV